MHRVMHVHATQVRAEVEGRHWAHTERMFAEEAAALSAEAAAPSVYAIASAASADEMESELQQAKGIS